MNNLVIVLAHNQALFDQHLPYWEKHQCPILVIHPVDKPIKTAHERAAVGQSCHQGLGTLHRLKFFFERRVMFVGSLFIYEDDSICLDVNQSYYSAGFFGNVFRDIDGLEGGLERTRFTSPIYSNPPWVVDWNSLSRMREKFESYSLWEEGSQDRVLAAYAHLAGVPILNHRPRGYSRGTIDWNLHEWEVKRAIAEGGVMIHGIKTPEILARIEHVYENRQTLKQIGTP